MIGLEASVSTGGGMWERLAVVESNEHGAGCPGGEEMCGINEVDGGELASLCGRWE